MQGIPSGQGHQGGPQKPSLSWSAPSAQSKPAPSPAQKPQPQKTPITNQSSMTTYAGIFIAGVIVGGLLGWALVGRGTGGSQSSGTGTSTSMTAGDTGAAGGGMLQGLSVASGQEAGPTVAISNINVDTPTWVVIYDDALGVPGKALGAQLFFPVVQGGESSGTVSLVRYTLPAHSYLAAERVDNGDHIYDATKDQLVTDPTNGKPLTVSFTTK